MSRFKPQYRPLMLGFSLILMLGLVAYLYGWLCRALAGFHLAPMLPALLSIAALLLLTVKPIPVKARSIFIIYLILFALLQDAAALLLPLLHTPLLYALPPLLALAMLFYGLWCGRQVVLTRYRLRTAQPLPQGRLRIALLSDIHMGLAVDEAKLAATVQRINYEQPQLLLIAGDIVDDRTTAAEMQAACRILGQVSAPLGRYAVYGNHDLASHGPQLQFSRAELDAALAAAAITVLDDAVAELDGVTLLGRHDVFMSGYERKTLAELQAECRIPQPQILLDHQPLELHKAAGAGVMLMLSGHTHGGQLWPLGLLSSLLKVYELTYGHRQIGGTHFIVSSGLGMRGVKMRSGCRAEAVIIDLYND